MRGICISSALEMIKSRFNPAYAGNIIYLKDIKAIDKVQPRVCGEYQSVERKCEMDIGSTPRMRGILVFYQSQTAVYQVQPRVCGEYNEPPAFRADNTGSTPRMRGIFNSICVLLSCCGFNPAYAGNMISSDFSTSK